MSTYVRGSLISLRNNSSDEENNLDTPLVDNSDDDRTNSKRQGRGKAKVYEFEQEYETIGKLR